MSLASGHTSAYLRQRMFSAYAGDMQDLGSKIRAERQRRRMTQDDLADELDVSQATISRWEKGKQQPSSEELKPLATFLRVEVDELLDTDVPGVSDRLEAIAVVGAVEAGAWRDAVEWIEDDQYRLWMPPDPRYPGVKRYGLEVRGPSMNEIYPEGSVVIFVKYLDILADPKPGEKVICYRQSATDGVEATVKELRQEADGSYWLWPRSTHPAFQAPYPLAEPEPGEETLIVGRVIQSVRQE